MFEMTQFLREICTWIVCLCLLILAPSAFGAPKKLSTGRLDGFSPIEAYEFENGLTLALWPDQSTETAAVTTMYKVGALHETKGTTGIAHLFEHMMLRPSKYAPQGGLAFERTMGADVSAETRYRTTGFNMEVIPEKLDDVLRYHADIMRNLPLDAKMLANEKEAVRSEYLNWDNSPLLKLLPILAKAAYPGSIAASFITGERSDLDRIRPEDCLAFYRRYYAPNNTVLVITGKFDRAKALASVEKYYGSMKRSQSAILPKLPATGPAPQLLRVQTPGDARYLVAAYPVPFQPLNEREDSAFDLAMTMLFGGEASLAGQELIFKQKLAQSIEYQGIEFPSVFLTLAGPSEEKTLPALDKAIDDAQRLDAVTLRSFAFASRVNLMRELQTPAQRAKKLAFYLTHRSGVDALRRDLEADKAVPLAEVKAVIAKYFNAKHRVAVVGTPEGAAL